MPIQLDSRRKQQLHRRNEHQWRPGAVEQPQRLFSGVSGNAAAWAAARTTAAQWKFDPCAELDWRRRWIPRQQQRPNATLTVNNANDGEFDGAIQDGAGGGTLSLVKGGAGRLTLGSSNSFTGTTTINGGTLALGNGGGDGTLALTSAISGTSTAVA